MERTVYKRKKSAYKVAVLGMLTALAVVFGYVEYLIPFNIGIPGVKPGLANLVILAVLYFFSFPEALCVSLIRVFINSLLFGNLFGMMYGTAGAVLSLSVMWIIKKSDRFSIIGVSAAGGCAHNIGQMMIAYAVTRTLPVLWYMPILMICGTLTGVFIGFLDAFIIKRVNHIIIV